jgi:hypothetical protein
MSGASSESNLPQELSSCVTNSFAPVDSYHALLWMSSLAMSRVMNGRAVACGQVTIRLRHGNGERARGTLLGNTGGIVPLNGLAHGTFAPRLREREMFLNFRKTAGTIRRRLIDELGD